jgi:hypothetical protein
MQQQHEGPHTHKGVWHDMEPMKAHAGPLARRCYNHPGMGTSKHHARERRRCQAPPEGESRAIQFSLLPPFRKGGMGDFGAAASGKSPLTPLCKGGNGANALKTE